MHLATCAVMDEYGLILQACPCRIAPGQQTTAGGSNGGIAVAWLCLSTFRQSQSCFRYEGGEEGMGCSLQPRTSMAGPAPIAEDSRGEPADRKPFQL